ncbi:DUF5960 family protein [Veillonella intestinalis]|uniref:DUF5960 family protein n=1 Tax=Veillonella intestinalis TaxID=2941341 RepID=UPI00203EFC3B|nr:DUF5960 family protein [Veillonella intestinalis]
MKTREFQRNQLQFAYFTPNYLQFEKDFYEYSALDTPLTFLTDDILQSMAHSQQNFFKLNKENAKDNQDHYFYFKIQTVEPKRLIRQYVYEGHSVSKYKP